MSRIAKLVENTVGGITTTVDNTDPNPNAVNVSQEDYTEASENAIEMTRLLRRARELQRADRTSGVMQASLEKLHLSLEAMNADGGLTPEEFRLTQLALESHAQSLQIKPIGLGVSLESFADNAKVQVSLEEIEEVIAAVDANHAALAGDQQECAGDLCELLKSSLPEAAERLERVVSMARDAASDDGEGTIPAADISYALANGDEFPEDFPAYMQAYLSYAKKLAGPFMNRVGEAAEKASAFGTISFESVSSFDESAAKAFEGNIDPRQGLTDEDYETCLPGAGPLFADSENCVGVSGIFATIDKLAHERQPCNPDEFTPDEEASPSEIPRLSADEIVAIGTALHALAMECDTAQFQEDSTDTTDNLDKAIAEFAAKFDEAPDDVIAGVEGNAQVTMEYLQTMLDMARWTPVYFLANLVNTINAFTVYAERSLNSSATDTAD